MNRLQRNILAICTLFLPLWATSAVMLSNGGSGRSYSSDSSSQLHSVVGLPFAGLTKGVDKRIYSGYLKMPQVYSFMFNEAPKFVSDSVATVPVGSKWAYTAVATDPEDDVLSYKFTSIPSGFYVSADDHRVLKTELMGEANGVITVIATDPGGLTDTLNVAITAKKEVQPLVIKKGSVGDTAIEDELYASFIQTNYDGFEEDSLAFEIRLDVGPSWLKLQKNSSGQYILAGTPINGTQDTTVILSAFMKNNPDVIVALLNKKIIVIPVNDAPVLADQTTFTAIGGIAFTGTLTATDIDDITLTFELAEGPAGMAIAPTGVISWTPDLALVGQTLSFTASVTDEGGSHDTKEYSIKVAHPGLPVCQSVGPIDSTVAGAVTIPFVLADATNDALSIALEVMIGDSTIAILPEAITGVLTNITKDLYSGSVVWNSAMTLPGIDADSVCLKLTPVDATGAGASAMTNYFRVNNTTPMTLGTIVPANGAIVNCYNAATITVNLAGYGLDTSTITSAVTISGSVSKTFTHTVVSKTAAGFVIKLDKQPASGETITVTLNETPSDISGKQLLLTPGQEIWSYRVAYLGDFDMDDTIADIHDLTALSTYWYESANNMLSAASVNSVELAPAVGTAPHLYVTPDSLFDYNELVSFLRIWKWSHYKTDEVVTSRSGNTMRNQVNVKGLSRSEPSDIDTIGTVHDVSVALEDSLVQLTISVDDVDELVAGEYCFWYDKGTTTFNGVNSEASSLLELDGGQLFEIVEEDEGYVRIVRTRLAKRSRSVSGTGAVVSLNFISDEDSPITMKYTLLDEESETIDHGVREIFPRSVVTPIVAQSVDTLGVWPNPAPVASGFETELSSDVPELINRAESNGGVVVTLDKAAFTSSNEPVTVSIQILDALGNRIVQERDRIIDFQDSDYYGYYWSGYNSQSRAVTNGIYLVLLRWEQGDKSGIAKTVVGIKEGNAR